MKKNLLTVFLCCLIHYANGQEYWIYFPKQLLTNYRIEKFDQYYFGAVKKKGEPDSVLVEQAAYNKNEDYIYYSRGSKFRYTCEYDTQGKLIKKTSLQNGHKYIELSTYDERGYLKNRSNYIDNDTLRGKVEYKYNDRGHITETISITNGRKSGAVEAFEYDKSGTKLMRDVSNESHFDKIKKDSIVKMVTSGDYTYDKSGTAKTFTQTDSIGQSIQNRSVMNFINNENGKKIISYTYDAKGKLMATDEVDYDKYDNELRSIDGRDSTYNTQNIYNDKRQLIHKIYQEYSEERGTPTVVDHYNDYLTYTIEGLVSSVSIYKNNILQEVYKWYYKKFEK